MATVSNFPAARTKFSPLQHRSFLLKMILLVLLALQVRSAVKSEIHSERKSLDLDDNELDFQLHLRVLQEASNSEDAFVRPNIKEINNGGKLVINLSKQVGFPDDIVDTLNSSKGKDTLVLMQLTS